MSKPTQHIKIDPSKLIMRLVIVVLALIVLLFVGKTHSQIVNAVTDNGVGCGTTNTSMQGTGWNNCSGPLYQPSGYAYNQWWCPYMAYNDYQPPHCDNSTNGCNNGVCSIGLFITNTGYGPNPPGYSSGQNETCGCVQHDLGVNGHGTVGGVLVCASEKCCVNTCQQRSVAPPDSMSITSSTSGTSVTRRSDGVYIIRNSQLSTELTFHWNESDWGACDGNNCVGSRTCSYPSVKGFTIYIQGLNPENSFNPIQLPLGESIRSFDPASIGRYFGVGKYKWWVNANTDCAGARSSDPQFFIVNRPPTASGTILSHDLCLANASSRGYSGINPGRIEKSINGDGSSGINNPVLVTTSYTDLDGIADLNLLQVSMSNSAVAPGNAASSALGSVRYDGSYHLATSSGTSLGGIDSAHPSWGVCTRQGGSQFACDTSAASIATDNSIISYAVPIIKPPSLNTINIDWQIGLLTSSTFDGRQRFDVKATDNEGTPGVPQDPTPWTAGSIPTGNWYADLVYPAANVTINLTSPLSFNVIDSVTDNNSVILKTNKRCAATSLPNPKSITLTQTNPAITLPHIFDSRNAASLMFDPCFVDTSGTFATGYSATFGYKVDNFPKDAVLNFDFTGTDRACNTAPRKKTTPNSVDIALLPPWLMTLGGDSYANSYTQMNLATHSSTGVGMTIVNNQLPTPANPSLNGRPAYLSTYNLMKATGFTSWNSRDSANAFALLSYTDQNGKPKADSGFTDWYSFLKDRVTQNFTDSVSTITPTAPYNNDTTHHITGVPVNGPTTNPDKINVVQVNGSMTLNNVTCDTKTIFFITGDLRIEPPFVISDTPAAGDLRINGCMFIVQGTTTIGKGSNLGIQTGHNTRYDQVFAMIITGDFVSEKDEPQTSPLPDGVNDGLELTGSVITANKLSTDQFLRNIGLVYNQYAPSEIFVYDGGRYIKLFGVLLSNPVEFSLQEKPFIDTLSK